RRPARSELDRSTVRKGVHRAAAGRGGAFRRAPPCLSAARRRACLDRSRSCRASPARHVRRAAEHLRAGGRAGRPRRARTQAGRVRMVRRSSGSKGVSIMKRLTIVAVLLAVCGGTARAQTSLDRVKLALGERVDVTDRGGVITTGVLTDVTATSVQAGNRELPLDSVLK